MPHRVAVHLVLSACLWATVFMSGPQAAQEKGTTPVRVVASFSVLADFARQVGGDRVDVSSLVGPNGDAHVFDPSPADAARVAASSLVVVNGLGLEGWMERLIQASGGKAPVIVATTGVKPIEGEEEPAAAPKADTPKVGPKDGGPKGGGKPSSTSPSHHDDPHAWQSVANARIYVANIRDGLISVDATGRATYEANAARYLGELDALEGEVKAAIARIPAARRRIVTTHDAFGYFADAYGMTFSAPSGVSTESEASAKDVARIIRQIRADKVPAVFLENISDPRLMNRIAKESGARIGAKLYSDALSEPGGPAATYLDMMRNNVRAFEAALAR